MTHQDGVQDCLQDGGYEPFALTGSCTSVESRGKVCSIKAEMNPNCEWHTKKIMQRIVKFFNRQTINPDGMADQPKPKITVEGRKAGRRKKIKCMKVVIE